MFFNACLGFCAAVGFGIPFVFAQSRTDTTITIFAKENQAGDREFASIGNCLSLYQRDYIRPKVPTVNSISFEPDSSCLRFYEYECCSGRFYDFDPVQESSGSSRLQKIHRNVGKDSKWFNPRSLGPCLSESSFLDPVNPPQFLTEPNSTAEQAAKDNTNVKQLDDRNTAVYISYEQELGKGVNWLYNIFSLGWGYVKKNYGDSSPDGKLYGIYHGDDHSDQGVQNRASSYKDARANCRNVLSVFSTQNSKKSAQTEDKSQLDSITLWMAKLVDYTFNGVMGSPCNELWYIGDAWADIFRYDLYLKLGMKEDADRIDLLARLKDWSRDTPTRASTWYRDWFKLIYDRYNGTQPLVRFFQLRDQFFPKVMNAFYGPYFDQKMNLGEYVHFTSGAAGTNLWRIACYAFNLEDSNQSTTKREFNDAQRKFKEIRYTDFDKYKN